MTNRQVHEEAAGMPLDLEFFTRSGIDPDAEFTEFDEDDAQTFPIGKSD